MTLDLSIVGICNYIAILAFVMVSIGAFTKYGVQIITICGPILILWISVFLISLIWSTLWPFIWSGMQIVFWISAFALFIATFRYWFMACIWIFICLFALMFFVGAIFMWPIIFLAIFLVIV